MPRSDSDIYLMEIPNVHEWLRDILSLDAMTLEEAYWGARPPAELAVPELLAAMAADPGLYARGKLIELLGESGDMSVLPYLEKELTHSDESIRNWANTSIETLERKDLWQQDPGYR